jgi:hypothetical protein
MVAKRDRRARPRARPDQAGFFRRFAAVGVDFVLITLAALVLYIAYSEVRGALGGEAGIITQFKAGQPGQTFEFSLGLESQLRRGDKKAYLAYLRTVLTEEEYLRASKMSVEELKGAFYEELKRPDAPIRLHGGHDFRIIQELLAGYLYFILFFRLSGRTPGKRLFGLKVVDLRGRPRLTWYQAFERTHGYAASLLVGGLGFFQVLWDKGGLTMHDKLAGTTVVRLPKRPKPKPRPAPAAPAPKPTVPKPSAPEPPAPPGKSVPVDPKVGG